MLSLPAKAFPANQLDIIPSLSLGAKTWRKVNGLAQGYFSFFLIALVSEGSRSKGQGAA